MEHHATPGSTGDVKSELRALVDLVRDTLIMATTVGTPAYDGPSALSPDVTVRQALERQAGEAAGILDRIREGLHALEQAAGAPQQSCGDEELAALRATRDELAQQASAKNVALKSLINLIRTILLTMESWEADSVT